MRHTQYQLLVATISLMLTVPLYADKTSKQKIQIARQHKETTQTKYNLFTYQAPEKNNYPAELTMMIIDLKYDDRAPAGEQVKICELGDGFTSRYKGFDTIHGLGGIWSRFWTFLKTFNKPVWFIDMGKHSRFGSFYALDDFYPIPGIFTNSIATLEAHQLFRKQKINNHSFNDKMLSSYAHFIVKKYGSSRSSNTTMFRIKNPTSLILSEASRYYTNNKYRTTKLFQTASLQHLRPKSAVHRKHYYPELAQKIIGEFGCDMFVIKPINAALGNGIIMVDKKDLDKTLKKILKQTKDKGKQAKDPAYTYWRRDRNKIFIIEEYAPSKPILVNKELYDATMRVVLSAWNNDGHVHFTFLGAYWKLPMYPLGRSGACLTDMHKSKVKRGRISSAAVCQEDFDNVIAQLCKPLSKVYTKMVKKRISGKRYRSSASNQKQITQTSSTQACLKATEIEQ